MLKKLANLTILLIVLFSMNSVAIAANHVMYNISQEVLVFTDMHGHWAQETVNWAVEKGVVTGYKDGTFKPNHQVTESEFLAMLIRAYMPDLNAIPGAHWAEHYYELAKEKNYPIGIDARSTVITRGYVAELVSATQGVNYVGDNAIQYLLGEGLAKGSDPNKVTIESYNAKGKLSRAEAVQFIKNLIEKGNQELGPRPTQPSDVSKLPSLPGSEAVTNPGGATMIGNVEYVGAPVGFEEYNMSVIPADNIARPIMEKVIESITAKNGLITVKVPTLPKGYELMIKYSDRSQPNGTSTQDKSFLVNPAKEGETYNVPYYGDKGLVVMTLSRYDNGLFHGVDGVNINIPSLTMTSEFGGW